MSTVTFIGLVITLALLLSALLCRLWMRRAPLDHPDGTRKLQPIAVPSAGGLGFGLATVLVWLGALVLVASWEDEPLWQTYQGLLQSIAGLLVLSLSALFVGTIDDLGHVRTRFKFVLLSLVSVIAVAMGLSADSFFVSGFGHLDLLFGFGSLGLVLNFAGSALWLFVFMNAANFMDGANGVVPGSLLIMLVGLLVLAMPTLQAEHNLALAALIGALCGFLIWNLSGRLYAGDAGAFFAAAIFAGMGLTFIHYDLLTVWTPATLALPFLIDVFLTLVWRVKHGENILHPHRNHAYQLLLRKGWGHIRTAVLWWGMSALCVAAGVRAALTGPDAAFWTFWGLLAVGITLWVVQRRVLWPQVVAREAAQ